VLSSRCYRVKPACLPRLEAWLGELARRRDEVQATFRDEGVRSERVFLIHHPEGPLLFVLAESEDPAVARAVFQRSVHPIDAEHRAVLAEVLEGPVPCNLAFEAEAVGAG
jgi:hypothetical protein